MSEHKTSAYVSVLLHLWLVDTCDNNNQFEWHIIGQREKIRRGVHLESVDAMERDIDFTT